MIGRLLGWDSPKAVSRIHTVLENLETIALAVAIVLEVVLQRKVASDVAWVVLVGVDIAGRVYGYRNNLLSEAEKQKLEAGLVEANRARVKIEEELFKEHVLVDAARTEFIQILTGYKGRRRTEIFVYDHHIEEVFRLADSIRSAFLAAMWECNMWIGPEPRIMGSEVTFAIARECAPPNSENIELQQLSNRLSFVLAKIGIPSAITVSGFSINQKPLGPLWGWGLWKNNDVAVFRVQVGQRQLRSRAIDWPVTPPQA